MALIYTELYHDDCQRANENPLDPAHWTMRQPHAGFNDGDVLQLFNNTIRTTTAYLLGADGTGIYNPALPNDQYCEVTIGNIVAGGRHLIYLCARAGTAGIPSSPLKPLCIGLIYNNLDGTGTFEYYQVDSSGGAIPFDDGPRVCTTWQPGDKFTFAIVGDNVTGNAYLSKNGVVLRTVPLSASPLFLSHGQVGLQVTTPQNVPGNDGETTVTRWAAGSVVLGPVPPSNYSVPDCRVPPAGPNASRNVQGTLTYDVETSSNAAVPGTDDRTQGAPVDSRTTGNVPTNSRTPGTFGPGE